ncbi:MAG TPA: hypothetical protein VFE62_19415, partial [Gemmataceae bacterium]|nr:hypothetical protein [Gemmataceae bacterium]
MTVLAFDWNATRVRGVVGRAGEMPLPMPLEPPHFELPLAIGLDHKPDVGASALARCRSASRQTCASFLPHLGSAKRWHTLNAEGACDLIWQRLQSPASSARAVVLTLPAYLQNAQADALRKLGEKSRLPMLGSISTLLAAALAGHALHYWQRSVLVIDADDHAMSLGWVKGLADRAHLIEARSFTQLGVRAWKERQIDALSDRFIREHRRDPRDVPSAEQSIFDQLDALALAALTRRPMQVGVNGTQWFKHLLVRPEHTIHHCRALAQQAAQEAAQLLTCWPKTEMPPAILVTHQASRLPGFIDALRPLLAEPASSTSETILPPTRVTGVEFEDFGEDLLVEETPTRHVMVLTPEAPAQAAHGLVRQFRSGALPAGHVDKIVPMGPALPKRAGEMPG